MPRKAVKVIVHADDFGLTEGINEGILRAHLRGILTSASIVANGEAFDHAVKLARSTPTLDLGVHLTLIEEKPVVGPEVIPTLVNSDGRFHQHALEFAQRYLMGRFDLNEVRLELEAQVEKVLAAGLSPTHLDGHQHLHVLPGLLRITVEIGRKYGIPAIRLPREKADLSKILRVSPRRVLESQFLNVLCWIGRNKVDKKTDSFAGFLFGGNLKKELLLIVLRHLPPGGVCEIMCHPGLEGPGSRYSQWGYHWLDELNALVDEEVQDFVRREGIDLVSYRALCLPA